MSGSFELLILGSSSATPTSERYPSAQLLNIAERFFLIDCGEGTQMQLRRYKTKFQRINHIMISHLHGDHYLGLMGFLQSLHLLGRTVPLDLYCSPALKEILDVQFKYSETHLNYELVYHFLNFNTSEVIFEDARVKVETIILNHRVPCCGFVFREKSKPRKMITEKIQQYKIPPVEIARIKEGADFVTFNGETILNKELTVEAEQPRSFAYCSDTCYDESILPAISQVDLLYHEATFMNNMKERAKQTYHSTTIDAATIAKKAAVKKLLIGHFSARYPDIEPLKEEAKTVFENTDLAVEGEWFVV